MSRALVGVPCDHKQIGDLAYQSVGTKYLEALGTVSDVQPVLIPTSVGSDGLALLDRLDGILLPGSPSNVHPRHYDGPGPRDGTALDPGRDGLTLPLIRACLARGLPLFAICRGFQELNVALGGSLHAQISEVPTGRPPRLTHGEDLSQPADIRYAASHWVSLTAGGQLRHLLGAERIFVNSLHNQAIERLAPDLRIEAQADDGLVEAVHVAGARAFALGVQWHPDWRTGETDHYAALFRAFGAAVARRHQEEPTP